MPTLIILLGVIAVVVLLVVVIVAVYNGLVRSRLRVREAWSGIDVQLTRRDSPGANRPAARSPWPSPAGASPAGVSRTARTPSASAMGGWLPPR